MVSRYANVNLARLYGCTCREGSVTNILQETERFLVKNDIENKISTLKLRGYNIPTPEDKGYETNPANLKELNELYNKTSLPLMPILSTSGITENSASIKWSSDPYPASITGYHFTLINNDNGQTIKQVGLMSGYRNSFETNLIPGTNYKASVIAIKEIGKSDESNISFKTLGAIPVVTPPVVTTPIVTTPVVTTPIVTTPVVTTPIVTTPVVTTPSDMTIINKFEKGELSFISFDFDFWFQYDINSVKNGSVNYQDFLNTYNGFVNRDLIIDTTITTVTPTTNGVVITPTTPTVTPTIDLITEFDVNVYKLDSNGNVFNDIHLGIDRFKLEELEGTPLDKKYFVTRVGTPTPTDQEIKDFYNYIDVDTSIKETMVEARFLEFKIVDGYVEGKIDFQTTSTFTNYWKDKIIYAWLEVKDQAGSNILIGNEPKQATKVNELKFLLDDTETISYREYIGNIQAVTLEVYVWDITQEQLLVKGQNAFSYPKELEVVLDIEKICPTGYHKGFNGKCIPDGGKEKDIGTSLLGKVMGVTALIGTLALLGSKSR